MKLPGSRPDVLRTKALSGPSPVGGAFGGTESQNILSLDDFELQAAHYNMACAHARLGNLDEVSQSSSQTARGKMNEWCMMGDTDAVVEIMVAHLTLCMLCCVLLFSVHSQL